MKVMEIIVIVLVKELGKSVLFWIIRNKYIYWNIDKYGLPNLIVHERCYSMSISVGFMLYRIEIQVTVTLK